MPPFFGHAVVLRGYYWMRQMLSGVCQWALKLVTLRIESSEIDPSPTSPTKTKGQRPSAKASDLTIGARDFWRGLAVTHLSHMSMPMSILATVTFQPLTWERWSSIMAPLVGKGASPLSKTRMLSGKHIHPAAPQTFEASSARNRADGLHPFCELC